MPSYTFPLGPSSFGQTLSSGLRITFLGKGLFSPLREDPDTGDFQKVAGVDCVRQGLRDGILTTLGERVLQEELGTVVHDLAFEDEQIVEDLAVPSIRDFVDAFEPRVTLQNVSVRQKPIASPELLYYIVTVTYIVRATNKRDNLVFPFFLTEEEGF